MFPFALSLGVLLLYVTAATAHPSHECGMEDPSENDRVQARLAEIQLFGRTVDDMTSSDFSSVASQAVQKSGGTRSLLGGREVAYTLVEVPIVYHVLVNQDSGSAGSPSLTEEQVAYTTNRTNKLFEVYDKATRETVPFVTFFPSQRIVHTDTFTSGFVEFVDCGSLTAFQLASIVETAPEWQYQLHMVVCESNSWAGLATLPRTYDVLDPRHNLAFADFRAIACYDEDGNFLCGDGNDASDKASHARWWRNKSNVIAHEIGHLFGLLHTFQGFCLIGDGVSDTPFESSNSREGCPGLLPYDRDRDLFDRSTRTSLNQATSPDQCGGDANLCGTTCAACCTPSTGFLNRQCEFQSDGLEVVTEDEVDFPDCCRASRPADTCRLRRGIDPKNNVMSYSPDWCQHEFTPGQMTRMMAQIRAFKTYIYCNYATLNDPEICADIPCGPFATSPNCS